MAIDSYLSSPETYVFNDAWYRELECVSHREYCTGYYLDKPIENAQIGSHTGYIRDKAYFCTAVDYNEDEAAKIAAAGVALENEKGRLYRFIQRNKVKISDKAEMISPMKVGRGFEVGEIYLADGSAAESAPHPSMIFWCRVPFEVKEGDIMRAGSEE
jgi:putative protease